MMRPLRAASFLHMLNPSALNEPNDNDNDGNDKKNMNQSSHGVRADKSKKPEDQQNNCDGFEHGVSPFGLRDLLFQQSTSLLFLFTNYFIKQRSKTKNSLLKVFFLNIFRMMKNCCIQANITEASISTVQSFIAPECKAAAFLDIQSRTRPAGMKRRSCQILTITGSIVTEHIMSKCPGS